MKISRYLFFLGIPFLTCCSGQKVNNAFQEEKTKNPVVGTPRYSSFTVVIDPGHGGHNIGTSFKDLGEKKITLETAKFLKEYLEEEGVKVCITRDDDTFISLQDRVKISNETKPDAFVSIHYNSVGNKKRAGSQYGLETYYPPKSKYSIELAQDVHKSLLEDLDIEDRFIKQARYFVIYHNKWPSILIEGGYLSNYKEGYYATTHKRPYAKAIAEGLFDYFDARLKERKEQAEKEKAEKEKAKEQTKATESKK